MWYVLAHKVWIFFKWLWVSLFIAILIGYAANVAPTPMKDFANNFSDSVLGWFFLPGLNRILTFSILGLFIAITISAWLIVIREKRSKNDTTLQRYSYSVIEANQGLNPRGFSQSQALISVNVPLNDIFIHLYTVPDRPIYDVPSEQQKLLDELRQRSDLSVQEREELIQRLRVVWYSQLGQENTNTQLKIEYDDEIDLLDPDLLYDDSELRQPRIEQVIQQLTAKHPVAIILGAPGSGKSTAMRWLALYMANASLSLKSIQPNILHPYQIPILIRISDYAKRLIIENISFEEYFKEYFDKLYSDLPSLSVILQNKLTQGRCLVLFDGLDEVASDSLRRHVSDNIYEFIADYAQPKNSVEQYNRFIITSRIVGYEPWAFAKYSHYTLLDLEDQQIEQFLTNWCPAVERYQAMFAQGMKPLTSQQEKQTLAIGMEQKNRLLGAIRNSPGIKRLAVNPLMLTILALIQRSGRTLPHQRIELYQIVTRTLLDNWNKESGRRVFPVEEIPLAEQLLGNLAFRLHSSDPILTEQDVKDITRQTMTEFYQRPMDQIKESGIQEFIETLRSSSGLFVESGQGLFSFMHRTFQEFFVALYLLRKKPEDLKLYFLDHYHSAIWREPLLLAIAYRSSQSSRDDRFQASELIQALANANDEDESILHGGLLFAANCLVDCSAWSIDKKIQEYIANSLFDLYGNFFDAGRYIQLQHEIERVSLQWLRGQPQGSSQRNSLPPLLDVWRNAMCDAHNALRQEGAVRLLASIAPELPSCPKLVLYALISPLLQLTDLLDLPCPSEIKDYLPQKAAHPALARVEEYAFVALRLLDTAGPAGWLHNAWLIWNEEQPALLKHLTQHSLELGHVLTPASFPNKDDKLNRKLQYNIIEEWLSNNEKSTVDLQLQLLLASNSARFPHAYLFKQMLDRERISSPYQIDQTWFYSWDSFLQAEMAKGRSATYLPCLSLQIILWQNDEYKLQEILNDLVKAITIKNETQIQTLIAFSYIFVSSFIKNINTQTLEYLVQIINFRFLLEALDMLTRWPSPPRSPIPASFPRGYFRTKLAFGYNLHVFLNSPQVKINKKENYPFYRPYPSGTPLERDLHYVAELRDIRDLRDSKITDTVISLQIFENLKNKISSERLIDSLCELLTPKTEIDLISQALILSCMIDYSTVSIKMNQKMLNSIQEYEKNGELLSREHRLIITFVSQILKDPFNSYQTPFARKTTLKALKQVTHLTGMQVKMLLAACSDPRKVWDKDDKDDDRNYYLDSDTETIQEIAWRLLKNQYTFEKEAYPVLLEALDNDKAIICAAAALLLQYSKVHSPNIRKEVIQKVKCILADDDLCNRPLEPPTQNETWRLHNVLFETLKALEENTI